MLKAIDEQNTDQNKSLQIDSLIESQENQDDFKEEIERLNKRIVSLEKEVVEYREKEKIIEENS